MTRYRPHRPHLAASLLCAALCSAALLGEAHARTTQAQAGHPFELIICGNSATFDVAVADDATTLLEVPAGVENRAWPEESPFFFRESGVQKIYFKPEKDTPLGTTVPMRVWLPNGHEATIHATVVKGARGLEDNLLLYHNDDRERYSSNPDRDPCDPHANDPTRRLQARAHDRQRASSRLGIPEVEHVIEHGNGLDLSLLLYDWDDTELVIDFTAHNPALQPATITMIEVFDQQGHLMASHVWHWDAQGKRTNKTRLPVSGRQNINASIYLPNAGDHDTEQLLVKFHGIKGASTFYTAIKGIIRTRPMTEEEIKREEERLEAERRERERTKRERERVAEAKRTALRVRFLGGGLWTDDGAGQGMSAGTTWTGFGVRLTKGMHENFAIDAEISGGRSGDTRFQDVAWNQMAGDVTRRMSYGRGQGTAVVRFGDRYYVTSMRLGIGVQFSNYDSTMLAGGTPVQGPGDGFDASLFIAAGAGIEARLGKSWALGIEGALSDFFSSDTRLLEFGLHLGYRWSRVVD